MNKIPKIISFEEWRDRNLIEDVNFEDECPICEGTGTSVCDHCGSDIDCEECDGWGVVYNSLTRSNYDESVDRDVEKWENYYLLAGEN